MYPSNPTYSCSSNRELEVFEPSQLDVNQRKPTFMNQATYDNLMKLYGDIADKFIEQIKCPFCDSRCPLFKLCSVLENYHSLTLPSIEYFSHCNEKCDTYKKTVSIINYIQRLMNGLNFIIFRVLTISAINVDLRSCVNPSSVKFMTVVINRIIPLFNDHLSSIIHCKKFISILNVGHTLS